MPFCQGYGELEDINRNLMEYHINFATIIDTICTKFPGAVVFSTFLIFCMDGCLHITQTLSISTILLSSIWYSLALMTATRQSVLAQLRAMTKLSLHFTTLDWTELNCCARIANVV